MFASRLRRTWWYAEWRLTGNYSTSVTLAGGVWLQATKSMSSQLHLVASKFKFDIWHFKKRSGGKFFQHFLLSPAKWQQASIPVINTLNSRQFCHHYVFVFLPCVMPTWTADGFAKTTNFVRICIWILTEHKSDFDSTRLCRAPRRYGYVSKRGTHWVSTSKTSSIRRMRLALETCLQGYFFLYYFTKIFWMIREK